MNIDTVIHGFIAILAMIGLVGFGVHIGIALTLVAFVGMAVLVSPSMALVTVKTVPYAFFSNYSLVIVPMFILMGIVSSEAGIMKDLYNAMHKWLGRFRGGLLMVTVAASAAFGAVSGSTIVNATVFTRIAYPQMVRLGYKPGIGAAAIACAGTLASLIPPSITFVIYAILTEESIGQLLMAGLFPGILTTIIYMVGIGVCVRLFKDWAPDSSERISWSEKFRSLSQVWPVMVLSSLIIGGIYSGITPPSAAGGVGAVGAIIIVFLQRRMNLSGLWDCLKTTVRITSILCTVVIGGILFARFLTAMGFITELVTLIKSLGIGQFQFLLLVIVLFLFLGMFLDTVSILVITIPALHPIVTNLGIDPIWYAVIIVKLLEIAVVTPPVGINLFAVIAATDQDLPIGELFKGVIPFVIFDLITIFILMLFPAICTWLPETMF
jgi:tripartite ATP-independent transporter DctM subunit